MAVSACHCGLYHPGHDAHCIGVRLTFDRPGIEGSLEWKGPHAIFRGEDGQVIHLYHHRPVELRRAVALAGSARLLPGTHFLWIRFRHPPEVILSAAAQGQACFNVAFEPVGPCGVSGGFLEGGSAGFTVN